MVEHIQRLKNWINVNNLSCKIFKNSIRFKGMKDKLFLIISEKTDYLIDKSLCFHLDNLEIALASSPKITGFVFEFGGRWYYTDKKIHKNEFNEENYAADFNDLMFLGEYKSELSDVFPFVNLGVHSEYELLNGSHRSELWTKKAAFLKQPAIALVDKNTLGGVIAHQVSCETNNLKPIVGETITVAYGTPTNENELRTTYEVKLYVKNTIGWKNILLINKEINVDNPKYIEEEKLFSLAEGLIFVHSSYGFLRKSQFKNGNYLREAKRYIDTIAQHFSDDVYFQLDTVEFLEDTTDLEYLNYLKNYLENYYQLIPPVLINDCYYLEPEMYKLKEYLNKTDRKVYDTSHEQYYKTVDDNFNKLLDLSKDEDKLLELFTEITGNTIEIADKCNFLVPIRKAHMPAYVSTTGEDNETLFYRLIEEGLEREKILEKENSAEYIERLEMELDVMVSADLIDYFLILWDIINYCKNKGIYVGTGRGSVGGSLVTFLISITSVDPIKGKLMFERFLNKTRVMPTMFYEVQIGEEVLKFRSDGEHKGIAIEKLIKDKQVKVLKEWSEKRPDSLPDIDVDFQNEERNNVKQYISQRFGKLYSCSLGTYNRLKPKAALKDFARVKGIEFSKANFYSSLIPNQLKYTWKDVIKFALNDEKFELFIQQYPEIITLMKFALGQCRSASIHASAVVIVPKVNDEGEEVNLFDWMPVRLIDGLYVAEWEGKYSDIAGFLKEDILGLSQLDKFKYSLQLIKRNYNKDIDLNKLSLEDKKTYKLFQKGFNEDVFQFNSAGLKSYCKLAKPDNIEDLTAMNALYRPGPMDSGAHIDFALIKQGRKKIYYDWGSEHITKPTNGLWVYQEQIMQAMIDVGGFSLIESDTVRTQMKKFDSEGMKKTKDHFIKGAMKKGCEEKVANKLWDKLVAFSSYGFNKSHSYAYSLISYQTQWLKANYPLEFWTSSLQYAKEDETSSRLSEIRKLGSVKVMPPNINFATDKFECNADRQEIYWSVTKIKNVGLIAVENILLTRKEGLFKSFEDFVVRVPSKVNKRVIECLIVAGAFDELEGINKPVERKELLSKFYYIYDLELPDKYNSQNSNKNYFWIFLQKELTGFGSVDYNAYLRTLCSQKPTDKILRNLHQSFVDSVDFFNRKEYEEVTVVGVVTFKKERKYKKGTFLSLEILSNDELIKVTVWSDIYADYSEELLDVTGKIIAIKGKTKMYAEKMTLNSYENTILRIL